MTVSAVGNFCITVTNETATPTGGITCSALGGAVNRHLLRLRLTSARSSRRLSTRGSTMANVQISQGNSRDLPAYACRIYVTAFRASIGLWRFVPPHPAVPPLSASCSSGQHFASGFLQIRGHPRHPCLRLTLPLAGCVEDFHLQVTRLATTAKRVALTRNAPCLAHTKRPPRAGGGLASRRPAQQATKPQNLDPGSSKKSISSLVLGRSSTRLRCGKRPKRAITRWCCSA